MKPELITLDEIADNRGWFKELFHDCEQVNMSHSKRGVFRGFHYQLAPYQQTKKLYVVDGLIEDIVINLQSKEVYHFKLAKGDALYVPNNYAHGFVALEDSTILYGVDAPWHRNSERTINYKSVNAIKDLDFILSDNDKESEVLK